MKTSSFCRFLVSLHLLPDVNQTLFNSIYVHYYYSKIKQPQVVLCTFLVISDTNFCKIFRNYSILMILPFSIKDKRLCDSSLYLIIHCPVKLGTQY